MQRLSIARIHLHACLRNQIQCDMCTRLLLSAPAAAGAVTASASGAVGSAICGTGASTSGSGAASSGVAESSSTAAAARTQPSFQSKKVQGDTKIIITQ